MGNQLTNAPVFIVLCQLQISQISDLRGLMKAIIGEYKTLGLIGYQELTIGDLHVQFDAEGKQVNSTRVDHSVHEFSNVDKNERVMVAKNWMTYETTCYVTFDQYLPRLLNIFNVLAAKISPIVLERVGLRFVNAVVSQDRDRTHYFKPELLGLKIDGITRVHAYSENRFAIDEKTHLFSRLLRRQGRVEFPPDLHQCPLKIPSKFLSDQSLEGTNKHWLLDNDCFREERVELTQNNLKNIVENLHKYTDKAFKGAVTENALQEWS